MELLYYILEKLLGKDVLNHKVNLQLGMLVLIVVAAVFGSIYAYRFKWQWTEYQHKVDAVPNTVSNIMSDEIKADILPLVESIQRNVVQQGKIENANGRAIGQLEKDRAQDARNLQRIDDYFFDKNGIMLNDNTEQVITNIATTP